VATADLGDVERATDWIAPAEEALGPIDVLINNAGVQIVSPTVRVEPGDGERLIALDLLVPLRITSAVLPAMLARRDGVIVQIASLAAIAPTPGMTHYSAAKAGLAAAGECLRGELRKTGVHVVVVYPGPIKTAMADAAMVKYESSRALTSMPMGTCDQLALKVRRAVEKRRARVVYPASYHMSRLFPGITRWFVDRFTPPLKTS
jgi:short-subunit dehydrogenase